MSTEFKREERYIVFKLSDVERYLTDKDRANIAMMKMEIAAGRDCANKPPFKGLIVEADWPEYEPTWKAIEARVNGAQPAPNVPEGFALVNADRFLAVLDREDWRTAKNRAELRAMLAAAPKPEVKP